MLNTNTNASCRLPATLLKKWPGKCFFMWIYEIFKYTFPYRIPPSNYFCNSELETIKGRVAA